MEENKDKEVVSEEKANKTPEKKVKYLGKRTLVVFAVLVLFFLGFLVTFRANYIETGEIGAEYLDVFLENVKYKMYIGIINFIFIFTIIYIVNKFIKKGLKQFFEEEQRKMPHLPNKSIALIVALVSSIVVSNMFLQKVILFVNNAQFGTLNDPIFNMDAGFYMFIMPLIGQLAYYIATMTILLTVYTVVYHLIVFNVYFDGVNAETLKKSLFIKLLLFYVMVIAFLVALIMCFNVQNMVVSDGFLTLKNQTESTIIGSGAVDGIKLWGYRIFAFVIILSVYMAIRAFKKNNTKKVIKSLATIPVYLIMLFVVMSGYNIFFIRGNELDKQKAYISTNINYTKTAYDIKLDEVSVSSTGTITDKEAEENRDVIDSIPIVTKNAVINNLLQTQTNTGYYTYNGTKALLYNDDLVYISARELDEKNASDVFTHGYGAVIASASETDEAGNIKYISRDFEDKNIKQPRIYYGVSNLDSTIVSKDINEIDYPKGATENESYNYDGKGGVSLGLLDRLCVAVKEGNLSLVLSDKESKILLNRNVIDRAEKIIPYLMYDENPYLVINDQGKLYWVIDAYTVSAEFPYSQKTKVVYKNETKEINYIRNSIKVIVNAFDGETKFYITDKTDPIAMVYNNMYKGMFEDGANIPTDISQYFTYPEFLYNIQSEVITMYHDVSPDVLYRGSDVWQIASYSNLVSSKGSTKMQPYYTMCKTKSSNKRELGLVNIYNQYGKESLNAYLVGTVENGKNKLSLYKFTSENIVVGPMQLDNLIEQDETISSEISSLNVTGTRISKEMIIVPIENTLVYVVPVYQTSLNETNSVPVLKKIIVSSGNKVAIGDTMQNAIKNLLSPNEAVSIEVEDDSTIEGLIDSIIKANNNLTESNNSNDWGQIGRDIETLQSLISQLKEIRDKELVENTENAENNVIDENIVNAEG